VKKYKKLVILFITAFMLTACGSSPEYSESSQADDKAVEGREVMFSSLSELTYQSGVNDYRISPYDLIAIDVFQAEELSQEVRVNPNGNISLPLVGTIKAAGLTQEQLMQTIKVKLATQYMQNPQVSVFIKEFNDQEITVEGEVKKPGVYPIKGKMTLVQAIAKSEGLSSLADEDKVILFRGENKAYLLSIDAIRKGKMKDPYLKSNDKIIVQTSRSRRWIKDVTGAIRGFVSPVSFF
jgi:polysaccharide export outer membrane protein